MKFLKTLTILFVFSIIASSCSQTITKIYVIRHAEKGPDTNNDGNPDLLNPQGVNRAQDLSRYLKDVGISAVYTTGYKRTIQTSAPLRTELGLDTLHYSPAEADNLVNRILADYPGKSVLVVGHSNTADDVINGFQGTPPLINIPDDEFDHMFLILTQKKTRINNSPQRYKTEVLHMRHGAVSDGLN